ncbi:MAG: GNAT family N-acetyltransferase [Myxococcota bacterium]
MAGQHRRACVVLRGSLAETRDAAIATLARLEPAQVLWVGAPGDAPPGVVAAAPQAVPGLLGRAFDAVVLDVFAGLDADLLGQVHGFIRGGGALVLRMPPCGTVPERGRERLAAWPFTAADVGQRFHERFERALARHASDDGATPIAPPPHTFVGTREQDDVVGRLLALFEGPPGRAAVLTADRGRGKSSALGLAIAALGRGPCAGRRVVVTAVEPDAADEVFRFAEGHARFVPLHDLMFGPTFGPTSLDGDDAPEVIVVDEAAQVPVPVLRRLGVRYAAARLAFATTVRGYEGTGRGFALRFVSWLEAQGRGPESLALSAPIRWAEGCPLERFVFDALLLDAELAPVGAHGAGQVVGPVSILDRHALAHDERDLHDLFGLLVHAHYRTTPGDLQRLLDAPNLAIHALRSHGRIVAACLVAKEGGLPDALVDDVFHGRTRLRAHALADALVSHLGRREAGRLTMIRSVRIAVHPALRRLGLARRLVEHVHASYAPDLFGTLFGATEDLVRFRREVGYELVRVSASRGARTGEPSALMLRPASEAARTLFDGLRAELARELPLQLELLQADGELVLEPALAATLVDGLPPAAPLSPAEADALVRAYAFGPRTFESTATAISAWVEAHPERVARLDATARAVVEGRVRLRRSWAHVARAAGLPSLKATMRALRRAVRAMLQDP